MSCIVRFQSTPPARGATSTPIHGTACSRFQSTPPARGATGAVESQSDPVQAISIHAPREGGDRNNAPQQTMGKPFQSTPPARGATSSSGSSAASRSFQSTPPARGATENSIYRDMTAEISIHAPREGGDHRLSRSRRTYKVFQSTPPARGATFSFLRCVALILHFNPRPPRGGRPCKRRHSAVLDYFNPRPPRGGRLQPSFFRVAQLLFQSTPPARGAT